MIQCEARMAQDFASRAIADPTNEKSERISISRPTGAIVAFFTEVGRPAVVPLRRSVDFDPA